jgi:hypothetical protein
LPAFDAGTPIWQTFPRTCNVTIALARGDPRKVVLARASVIVKGGKHVPKEPYNPKTFSGWVQVHHFKWDAGVIERLRYRIRPEWQARYPWWVESQRLLDYFLANGLRFRPSDLTTIALNGAHFVAFG